MLCFDVYSLNLAFGRAYKPLLEPLGLTYPQYLVLLTLWAEDRQSVGRIGAALGLDSSTLTPLLKRLEAAGVLRRHRDDQDERRVLVSLTEAGRVLQQRAEAVPATMAEATGMTLAEMRQMHQALTRLRQALRDGGMGGAGGGDPCA
ncbi:MarR family transcriptional regulator [Paracoccus sp. 2205BS29-5]|uniref:MarR family transcriptional regulator n=2 Tax=Paracoccus spongiarum TaxID=3064387 RepID=A0ABT9JEJ6_9RHOB|nr:MarR family transcriptional regulator [Paracoccus sp. 2205BS29-5]MDP5308238.1 MarR family transcriptional regulator [Paracoccus sp. 2205BS29-5]